MKSVLSLLDEARANLTKESDGERVIRTMNFEYAILQFAKMRNLVSGSEIFFYFEGTCVDKETTFLMTFERVSSLKDENEKRKVEVKLASDGWKQMTKKYTHTLGPDATIAFQLIRDQLL